MVSQNPHEKIHLWASMINVSVAIYQCQFVNFLNVDKGLKELSKTPEMNLITINVNI